jgi:hypothetical protein
LKTSLVANAAGLVGFALGTSAVISFMHPAMHLVETAFERADPAVFMPRLARRPLPGHPIRPIYEPVGEGDSYFPTVVYDAIALAYGHEQAGDVVWPTMQDALALVSRDGIVPYPISNDVVANDGTPYTGVVVQYMGDGIYDPHALYTQLPEVKHQYACFLSTHFTTGTAVVVAPGAVGSPCM